MSAIAFINNFLLSLERNKQSSDSISEENTAPALADEEAFGDAVAGDDNNVQEHFLLVEEDSDFLMATAKEALVVAK